jgi:flagellar hook-associated protein 1 FlgK
MGLGSLNIAYTGLNAHQRRIETIGENITNVDTPGYHRQRVDLQSITKEVAGVHAGSLSQAGGVRADTITRLRNEVLATHARQQGSKAAASEVNADTMTQVEQILGGLEEGGLHDQMVDLFNGFDDLAAAPEDGATRRVILQRANVVAQAFTRTAGDIDDLRERVFDQAEEDVRSINLLADQIADLDTEILKASSMNDSPNTLLDKRDQLVNKLAELANVTVQETSNRQVSVSLGGKLIVSAGRSSHVELAAQADPGLAALGYGRYVLQTTTGQELNINTGELAARLTDLNVTIPGSRTNLDGAASDLADQVNAIHRSGVGLDGSTGLDLFLVGPASGQLSISPVVDGQPDRVAAGKPGNGPLDNTNARELADLAESPNGPLRTFVSLVSNTAAQVSTSRGLADAATTAKEAADSLALQDSGVSLDEELADLVAAQRSYEASARVLTSIDEMLQTLIGIGLVGR